MASKTHGIGRRGEQDIWWWRPFVSSLSTVLNPVNLPVHPHIRQRVLLRFIIELISLEVHRSSKTPERMGQGLPRKFFLHFGRIKRCLLLM